MQRKLVTQLLDVDRLADRIVVAVVAVAVSGGIADIG